MTCSFFIKLTSSRTHQVECFTIWLDFMLLHVLYKAAVCVSETEKKQLFTRNVTLSLGLGPLNPLTCSSESLSLMWSVLASFWCLPSLYLSNERTTGLHQHVTPPLTPEKQIIWIVGPGLQGFLSTNTHQFPQQTLIAKRTCLCFAFLFYDFWHNFLLFHYCLYCCYLVLIFNIRHQSPKDTDW